MQVERPRSSCHTACRIRGWWCGPKDSLGRAATAAPQAAPTPPPTNTRPRSRGSQREATEATA
eukprot:scaffold68654_cov69-Phaeocystis_antarctica.AAC.2